MDSLVVGSEFAYRGKRKGSSGKEYKDVTRQDRGSSINTEMLDYRELSPCSLRTAHSTRQQASLVHGSPRLSSHLIHLLAVLSSQCSGLSSPMGEMAAPSLPQEGPQERVGAERRGSSPGLPQHPPTLGSARWSLREILPDFSAITSAQNPSLAHCWGRMRAPALLLVVLAPGKCVAWMLLEFFCILWQGGGGGGLWGRGSY